VLHCQPGAIPCAQAIVDVNDMSARTPAILSVCMRPLLFEDEPSGTPATRRNGTHLGMRRTARRCSHTGVRQGEDGDSFVSAAASTRAQFSIRHPRAVAIPAAMKCNVQAAICLNATGDAPCTFLTPRSENSGSQGAVTGLVLKCGMNPSGAGGELMSPSRFNKVDHT